MVKPSKRQRKSVLVHYYVKEGEQIPNPGRIPLHVAHRPQGTALDFWFEEIVDEPLP